LNYLLDTHLLIWAANRNPRLPDDVAQIISRPDAALWVSVVSIFEVAVKRSLDRRDFRYQAGQLRAGLLANGYTELPVEGRHVLLLATLPLLHTDPFDRLLIAQAVAEGMMLLTADRKLEQYGHPVRFVR
jgi:PIN domain nuclease of toxin-antitoxin system